MNKIKRNKQNNLSLLFPSYLICGFLFYSIFSIQRSQAGILSAFSLPTNVNSRQVDEETTAKVKGYGAQVKHTFVDSVFGGLFISTVQCEECKMPSQIFEPFLDVSLPVTEEKVGITSIIQLLIF